MSDSSGSSHGVRRIALIGLPVLVLIVSAVIALWILQSKPTAQRAAVTQRQARLVTVTPAEAAPATIAIRANGTVEAADATELHARVAGQIVALEDKLAPGTRFDQGDVLARIDDSDYRLALKSAQTDLANAKADLRVEQGQQAVARRELALVGTQVSDQERDLALRGPQLEQARANVQAAETSVEQAKLDLQRTAVRAPFNGIVTERSASLGDVVTSADAIATLAATDVYWVNVSLPVDQLRWLHAATADTPGSPARIYYPAAWGDDTSLGAEVLRIQPALETSGRMARVLLRVPDPLDALAAGTPRLLLDAYVTAAIEADTPANSVVIDSSYVHENRNVWVMSDDDTLDIRSVDIAYRDDTEAVITAGLAPGDAVVTSELTAPIQGMPLRVDTQATAPASAPEDNDTSAADKPVAEPAAEADADALQRSRALGLALDAHAGGERRS